MKNPKELHAEFVKLGKERYKLMNKLLLILPAIYESGIWKNYASDIYEYAGRFGGISKSAAQKRLQLEKHLENKPQLTQAILKVGINKVALMATLADEKNEGIFADKVLNMSKSALCTLSKELRLRKVGVRSEEGGGVVESITEIRPCQAKAQLISLQLDEETSFLFLKFKQKMEKKLKKMMNNKETMRELLLQADENFTSGGEKETGKELRKNAKSITGDENFVAESKRKTQTESRHIRAVQKRQTLGNGKCQYPKCNKPSMQIHHTNRYAKTKTHNKLTSLCKDHHEFMHNGLVENERTPNKYWAINLSKTPDQIDELYRKYRQG